ncbi:MAG: hypothetical protein KJ686_06875 [Actinobacteria bacterium]|nr:hypothetical protein [Actinomycetota bacterium]
MKVKCDACEREFNKIYWDMEPHLCRRCQSYGKEACVECEGWCCERPNEEGRIALLEDEKERFGVERDWMWAEPCRYRDPVSGLCLLKVRFQPVVCKEYVCEDMVKAARARLEKGKA